MPHRMVGILSLLLVFALEMRAQGEVVLSIDGEPVKRSEFEYYFRKSSHRTPLSFLPDKNVQKSFPASPMGCQCLYLSLARQDCHLLLSTIN